MHFQRIRPTAYAIVSKSFRYIRYNDGSEELYNKRKDVHEWRNLADNPEYTAVIAEHRSQIPQAHHPIFGTGSTGHKSYQATEAKRQSSKKRN